MNSKKIYWSYWLFNIIKVCNI